MVLGEFQGERFDLFSIHTHTHTKKNSYRSKFINDFIQVMNINILNVLNLFHISKQKIKMKFSVNSD